LPARRSSPSQPSPHGTGQARRQRPREAEAASDHGSVSSRSRSTFIHGHRPEEPVITFQLDPSSDVPSDHNCCRRRRARERDLGRDDLEMLARARRLLEAATLRNAAATMAGVDPPFTPAQIRQLHFAVIDAREQAGCPPRHDRDEPRGAGERRWVRTDPTEPADPSAGSDLHDAGYAGPVGRSQRALRTSSVMCSLRHEPRRRHEVVIRHGMIVSVPRPEAAKVTPTLTQHSGQTPTRRRVAG
jgi:hypothetical protein